MKIEEGDYFKIPLKNGEFGIGYVIALDDPAFYIGALSMQFTSDELVDIELFKKLENFVFFGNFLGELFENNDWKIIGNSAPEQKTYPFPLTKIKIDDNYIIENFKRQFIRKASDHDIQFYDNPTNRSPMILQNALNAFFGLHKWIPRYNKIKVDYVISKS